MMVESNPPNARLLLNDIFIGGTPREVHLEVDESGNLLGTIEVRIEYALVSRGAGVLPLSSPPATATLQSGRRPPARLSFDGTIRSESGGPAPPDSTRTAPSIRATN